MGFVGGVESIAVGRATFGARRVSVAKMGFVWNMKHVVNT